MRVINQAPLFQRFSGSGAIAVLAGPTDRMWAILEWRIHLGASGGAGDTIVVSAKNTPDTPAFNTVMSSTSLNGVTDARVTTPYYLSAGQQVAFAWTNSGAKSYGLEVFYEEYDE